MSIFKEIAKQSGLDFVTKYSIINYGGETLYVEGFKRLLYIAADAIRVSVGKSYLEITGSDLKVSELETGVVIIKGKIISVTEHGNI